MTGKELLAVIAAQREERCQMVLNAPEKFKICNACFSLLFEPTIICPFCHAYGFDSDPAAVVAMAKVLGDRPLAVGCPVLPRQTTVKALTFA